jgi:hypothetical protein
LPKQEAGIPIEEKKYELIATTKPPHLTDYPSSEIYQGNLTSTNYNEAEQIPIDQHVQIVHSGYSDLEPIKKESAFTLPSFFKKEHKDYPPISTPYEGPVDSIDRHSDIDLNPLESHVSVYSSVAYEPKSIVGEQKIAESVPEHIGKFFMKMLNIFKV